MSKTLKEKGIATDDEGEYVTSQESANSNDEGPTNPPRHGSITPPDKENYKAAQIELLRSTTDCGGYVAGVSSGAEGEKGAPISPSEMQVNLLDKTRIWKNRQLKEQQYDSLKSHFVKLAGRTGSYRRNWYIRFAEISSKKPKTIEDFTCECERQEEKPTKPESTAEKSITSIKSPIQQLEEHTSTCNVKRLSLYFSYIAEYFIGEEVDPDIFLYIPFPKEKYENTRREEYEEDSADYKYYILQENRKILILKLWEGLRTKLESWVEGMTINDRIVYEYRNEVRIAKHLVLNNMLEDLVKPYENFTYWEENNDYNDDSNQNPSKQTDDQIYKDKCRYLLVKAEYLSLKKRLEDEALKRRNEQLLIDIAIHGDYCISHEDLERQKNYKEDKLSTSKNKNELELEKMIETEHATDKPESKIKKCDSEQETEEQENKRKKGDSEQETEEQENKRKKSE